MPNVTKPAVDQQETPLRRDSTLFSVDHGFGFPFSFFRLFSDQVVLSWDLVSKCIYT